MQCGTSGHFCRVSSDWPEGPVQTFLPLDRFSHIPDCYTQIALGCSQSNRAVDMCVFSLNCYWGDSALVPVSYAVPGTCPSSKESADWINEETLPCMCLLASQFLSAALSGSMGTQRRYVPGVAAVTSLGVFFKSLLLNLLQYCFCVMVCFFWPGGMLDLSPPTRDWTHTTCIGRQSLNHWTAREVPALGAQTEMLFL